MKRLSYEDIASYWVEQDGFPINRIALNDDVADIDKIIDNVYTIVTIPTTMKEEKHTPRKTAKRKPSQSSDDDVAHKVGNNVPTKYGHYFFDHSHIIKITLEDGSEVEGEIRVSNHEIDLTKWKQNNTHDFGISIEVYEEEYELIGNTITRTGNRIITIFEYIFNNKRANQNILDALSAKILGIKIPQKYVISQPVCSITSESVTTKEIVNSSSKAEPF